MEFNVLEKTWWNVKFKDGLSKKKYENTKKGRKEYTIQAIEG